MSRENGRKMAYPQLVLLFGSLHLTTNRSSTELTIGTPKTGRSLLQTQFRRLRLPTHLKAGMSSSVPCVTGDMSCDRSLTADSRGTHLAGGCADPWYYAGLGMSTSHSVLAVPNHRS